MSEINRKNFPGLYWLGRSFIAFLAAVWLTDLLLYFGWPTAQLWVLSAMAVLWIAGVVANIPKWLVRCLDLLASIFTATVKSVEQRRTILVMFAASCLFFAAVACWVVGDTPDRYNVLLIALGWLLVLAGIWVIRARPTLTEMKRAAIFAFLAFLAIVAVWRWGFDGFHTPLWYSVDYGVDYFKLVTPTKPHDCEIHGRAAWRK